MVSVHTYTFGHVYYDPPMPLHVYTLVIILYIFYFRFIYSILYILHTLTSEIQVHLNLCLFAISYFTHIKSLCSDSHSLCLDSHSHCSSRTHSHTFNIPPHFLILPPHTLLRPQNGWPDTHTFRSFVLWCFIWFDSDLIGIVQVSMVW